MTLEERIDAEAQRFRFREELRQLVEDASDYGNDATLAGKIRRFELDWNVDVRLEIEDVRTRRDLRRKEHRRRSRRV